MTREELLRALGEIEATGMAKAHLGTTPRRWRMVGQARALIARIEAEPEVLAEWDSYALLDSWFEIPGGVKIPLPVHVTVTRRALPAEQEER